MCFHCDRATSDQPTSSDTSFVKVQGVFSRMALERAATSAGGGGETDLDPHTDLCHLVQTCKGTILLSFQIAEHLAEAPRLLHSFVPDATHLSNPASPVSAVVDLTGFQSQATCFDEFIRNM